MTLRHIKNNIAFSSACRHFAVKSLSVLFVLFALALTSFTLVSCSDLLSPVNPIERPDNPNPSTNPASSETSEIVISGSINRNESNGAGAYPSVLVSSESDDSVSQNASGLGRMALPSLNMANAAYYVIANATGQTEREGTVNETQHTFSIPLSLGSAWTIELGMYIPDSPGGERTAENTKFKGTYTYNHSLTADDVNTPVSINLVPLQNGNGHIALNISAASGLNVDVDVISEPVAGTWNAAVGNNPDFSSGINISSIKSGTYRLKLVFTDSESNQEVYYSEQDVNVYDNMTTNTWVGDSSSNSPVIGTPSSGNYFTVDSSLINAYRLTTFYVGGTGASDTNGDGTSYAPFETVSKALTVIGSGATGTDYVIWLKSDIYDNFSIANNVMAGSITIKGRGLNTYDEPWKISNNGASANDNNTVNVASTFPVILEDIAIDGDYDRNFNETGELVTVVGLRVGGSSNVTLKNCTIQKTNRSNGSAIYNSSGTVTLENCTVSNCRSETVTSGSSVLVYNSGTLNLIGCTIENNTAKIIVFNNDQNCRLKLGGNISIPTGSTQIIPINLNASSGTGSQITIADNFSCSGTLLLELLSYANGSTVLVPETNGATSVVASAASKFTLTDGSYSIGTSGDDIGKLVLNPNIYVSSSASSPAGNDTTGDGSAAKPFASIQAAVNKISELNTAANYIIRVTGDVDCEAELSASTLGTAFPSSTTSTLTICGDNKATDKLKGSDAGGDNTKLLVVNCANKVTIQNLTLYGLTSNGYAALQIDSESANVEVNNCDITGNTHTGSNSQGNGGGIYNKGTLTLNNCNVTENKAVLGGGIYHSKGVVTIEDCTIQNNTSDGNGGGIFLNNVGSVTLNVKGNITITGNKKGTGTNAPANNIHLTPDKVITVIGSITGSNIGVTTGTAPTATSTVKFTSGFNANNDGADPNTIFTSDEGYALVVAGTGSNIEAYLAASGGGISTVFDYNVALSCSATSFTYGSSITVSATVTKNGVAVSPAANDITWGAMLLCYGDQAVSLSGSNVSASAGSVTITIPGSSVWTIFNGLPYTLHVTAVYKDVGKDINVDLTGTVN